MSSDQRADTKPSHQRWLAEPLQVRRGQVSGIPAFWVPSDAPLTAGVVFRSGAIDEPLAMSGINRIIEHLIMGGANAADDVGFRNSSLTSLGVTGSPEKVVAGFVHIAGKLGRGLSGVDAARVALSPVFSARPRGPIEELLRLRHGAHGLGNAAFDAFGLMRAGEREIDAWRKSYLHNASAAIWIAGAFPDGLRMDLPTGDLMAPTNTDVQIALPAATVGAGNVMAISVVSSDSFAFGAATWLLLRRLRSFEQATSLCSNLRVRTERCSDGRIELLCAADIDESRADEATSAILDVIERLAHEHPTEKELEDYRETVVARFFDANGSADLAYLAASNQILNGRDQSWDVVLQELQALDGSTVCAVLDQSLTSAILMLPPDVSALDRFTLAGGVDTRIEGANFEAIRKRGESKAKRGLIASPEGITSSLAETVVTVRFADVVTAVREPQGRRKLITTSGTTLVMEPSEWKRGEMLTALIDKAIPPENTVYTEAYKAGPAELPMPEPRKKRSF